MESTSRSASTPARYSYESSMASAKRGVLRWPQSSVAVLMNFLALHVTPRSFGKLYKRDSSNTARHAVGAGAFRHY